ncbi:hypothetical protein [Crossiella sp. NPDC003009]
MLLAGPSGSGKSHLAARLGWPVLRLDDFYRDGDDPAMPVDEAGRADWDHPDSWNAEAALAAIVELASTGVVRAPVYSIGEDRRVGTHEVRADGPFFLAEGLFADRLVAGCRAAGVLADGIVLAPNRVVTFARRLVRDVAEARKPWPLLVRRGLRLVREQPGVVARCTAAGLRGVAPGRAGAELAAMVRAARVERAVASTPGERAALAAGSRDERAALTVGSRDERAVVAVSAPDKRAALAVSALGEQAALTVSAPDKRAALAAGSPGEQAALAAGARDECVAAEAARDQQVAVAEAAREQQAAVAETARDQQAAVAEAAREQRVAAVESALDGRVVAAEKAREQRVAVVEAGRGQQVADGARVVAAS